ALRRARAAVSRAATVQAFSVHCRRIGAAWRVAVSQYSSFRAHACCGGRCGDCRSRIPMHCTIVRGIEPAMPALRLLTLCFALLAMLEPAPVRSQGLTRAQIEQRLADRAHDLSNLEAPGVNLAGLDFA